MNARFPPLLLAVVCMSLLTACSMTVRWEEEVPLNTGEVILVKRADTYRRVLVDHGFTLGWGLHERNYEFNWNGKNYAYSSAPKSRGPAMIRANSNDSSISIIDSAWPACAGYGEYRWSNGKWILQSEFNYDLIGEPNNLMQYYSSSDGAIPAKVTQDWIRIQRFDLPQNGGSDINLANSKVMKSCSIGNKS